jgi:hypothetical protein
MHADALVETLKILALVLGAIVAVTSLYERFNQTLMFWVCSVFITMLVAVLAAWQIVKYYEGPR